MATRARTPQSRGVDLPYEFDIPGMEAPIPKEPTKGVIFGSGLEDESNYSIPGTPDGSVTENRGVMSVSVVSTTPEAGREREGSPMQGREPSALFTPTTKGGKRADTPGSHLKKEMRVDYIADIVPGSLSITMPKQNPGKSKSPPKRPLHIPRGTPAPVFQQTSKVAIQMARDKLKNKQGDMRYYEGVDFGVSSYDKPVQRSVVRTARERLGDGLSSTSIMGNAKNEYRQYIAAKLREEKRQLTEKVQTLRSIDRETMQERYDMNRRGGTFCNMVAKRLDETRNPHKGAIMRCITRGFVLEVVARWDMQELSNEELDVVIAHIKTIVVSAGTQTRDPTMSQLGAASATATVSNMETGPVDHPDVTPGSRLAMQLPGYGVRKPRVTTERSDPWKKTKPVPPADVPSLSQSLVVAAPPGCAHANLALGMAQAESLIRSAGPTEVVTSNAFHPKVANPNFKELTNPLGEVDYGPREKIKRDLDDIFAAFISECDTMTCMRITDVEKGAFYSNISPMKSGALGIGSAVTMQHGSPSRHQMALMAISSTSPQARNTSISGNPPASLSGDGGLEQDSLSIDLRSMPAAQNDMAMTDDIQMDTPSSRQMLRNPSTTGIIRSGHGRLSPLTLGVATGVGSPGSPSQGDDSPGRLSMLSPGGAG